MLTRALSTILIALSPFFSGSQSVFSDKIAQKTENIKANVSQSLFSSLLSLNPNLFPIRNWEAENPETESKAGLIYLISAGENKKGDLPEQKDIRMKRALYEQDVNTILPIASLTKLTTALVIAEDINLEDIVSVSARAVEAYGQAGGLKIGERLSVKNLLYALLMESSNDAAEALAEYYEKIKHQSLVDAMNAKVMGLGLKHSFFADPSGLDPRNSSTVHELARITEYSLNYPIIWEIQKTSVKTVYSEEGTEHRWNNTDILLNQMRNVLGGKTGYTEEAGGCLILLLKNDNKELAANGTSEYFLSIVLGAEERFLETEKLLQWVKKAYQWE